MAQLWSFEVVTEEKIVKIWQLKQDVQQKRRRISRLEEKLILKYQELIRTKIDLQSTREALKTLQETKLTQEVQGIVRFYRMLSDLLQVN